MSIRQSVTHTLSAKHPSVMTLRRLAVVFLFCAFFVFNIQAVRDPDLWWHLEVGDYMLETGTIPTADPGFAFTTAGKSWFMHEWLSEIIMAVVYRAAGLYGLSIFFGLMMVATHILIYFSSPGRPYVAGLVSFMAVFAVFAHTSARPHMFNLLLGAVIVYLVEGIKDKRFSARWLWLIPPLMVVWVNLHSGFLLGMVILGVYMVGETAAFLFGGDERVLTTADLRLLVIVTAVTGLASLINNNGLNVWLYPFETLSSEGMRLVIDEWQSPNFHNWYRMLFALLLVGSLVLMALNRHRPTVTELLFIVGTGLAGLQSVRHISLFIILAIPIVSRHLLALLLDIGLLKREAPVCRLRFVDAALPRGDLGLVAAEAYGGEDLDAAVAGVDLQRRVGVGRERPVQVIDAAVEDAEQLSELLNDLRVRPQQVDRILNRVVLGDRLVGHRRDEHVEQPSGPLRQPAHLRGGAGREERQVGGDAFGVVDVKLTTDGAPQRDLVRPGDGGWRVGGVEEVGPASVVGVEVVEVEP